MKWEDDKLLPVATDNPHECVNFQRIDDWMKSRTVQAWKPGLLIHPKLGKATRQLAQPIVIANDRNQRPFVPEWCSAVMMRSSSSHATTDVCN